MKRIKNVAPIWALIPKAIIHNFIHYIIIVLLNQLEEDRGLE